MAHNAWSLPSTKSSLGFCYHWKFNLIAWKFLARSSKYSKLKFSYYTNWLSCTSTRLKTIVNDITRRSDFSTNLECLMPAWPSQCYSQCLVSLIVSYFYRDIHFYTNNVVHCICFCYSCLTKQSLSVSLFSFPLLKRINFVVAQTFITRCSPAIKSLNWN